jgi:quercetin dioxygenase-like cupin family protein
MWATAIAAGLTTLGATTAHATEPSGLQSEPVARGAAGQLVIEGNEGQFSINTRVPTDVAVVRVMLAPGGFTGWHGHPGPGVVVVKSGSVTLRGEHQGQCHETQYGAGKSFAHFQQTHNVVNPGPDPAELYVVYFVPEGTTAMVTDAPAPAACP